MSKKKIRKKILAKARNLLISSNQIIDLLLI